ncbi:Nuclear receptor 2C2-associated protein [Coemansia biformis]|uniref:Nuclear receptor 2C2-associated protein n=1 Tax=Coemansia biformis TaxID=1286918 RepID=A0A9W8CY44_9FUNG|nr:Nuclear receptor 2C2-associated protein [Coemansia biformis]
MANESLVKHIASHRVSSVLNRDTASLGKQFLFDGSSETCWNSEQGTPQHILVEFARPVLLSEIRIQFQGGFAGKATRLIDLGRRVEICPLHPDDNNKLQSLRLPDAAQAVPRTQIKLQFVSSTDFYGRIIVYVLDFRGSVAADGTVDGTSDSTGDRQAAGGNSDAVDASAAVITIG